MSVAQFEYEEALQGMDEYIDGYVEGESRELIPMCPCAGKASYRPTSNFKREEEDGQVKLSVGSLREKKKNKRGLHAVVIPWPGQGHINPIMHFSRLLASHAGISVTFVNTQYNHDSFIGSWHEEDNIALIAIPDGLPEDMPRSVVNICRGMLENMGAPFEALLQKLLAEEGKEKDIIIIADVFNSFVRGLAMKYGVPRISFWTQSASSFACHLAVARGFVIPPDAQNSRCNDILDIPPTLLSVFDHKDFMFDLCIDAINQLQGTSCIVMNSSKTLEPDCLHQLYEEGGIPMFSVGPTLPKKYLCTKLDAPPTSLKGSTSLWEEDASCITWLNCQASGSVLYISFGSIAVLTLEQMEELALGLEASNVPILWVMRPNLIEGNSSILPKGFMERMGDVLRFVSWAPQLEVLSHKSIGGFLTHCGWNSTLESVVKKIPMLCWPYFADQPLDRRLIVDHWKVGLDFVADENGFVTRKEVEAKVKALMQDEEGKHIRNIIDKLGEAIIHGVIEENGSSHLEFNRFLQVINEIGSYKKAIIDT